MMGALTQAEIETFCDLVATAQLAKVQDILANNKAYANCAIGQVPVVIVAISEELPIMTRTLLESGADCKLSSFHCSLRLRRETLCFAWRSRSEISPKCPHRACAGSAVCGEASGRPGLTPLVASLRCSRPAITEAVVKRFMTDKYIKRGEFLSLRRAESDVAEEDKQAVRRAIVSIVRDTPMEQLFQGVAEDFQERPGQTLVDILELASASRRTALRMQHTDPTLSSDYFSSSCRIELAAAGCLEALGAVKDAYGRYLCDELLRSPFGVECLEMAISNKCKTFLTHDEVQSFFRRQVMRYLGT